MATPPSKMLAWTYTHPGHPATVLTLSKDHHRPTINNATDILIRISHCALNPGPSFIMQLIPSIFRKLPAIPEFDFSGVVVATGPSVPAPFNIPGTPVFGMVTASMHMKAGTGALAEYVVCPAHLVALKPENVNFEEAAGLGVTGCTALQVVDRAHLKPGDRVLVNGASGGIGSLVVQMAKKAVGDDGRVVAVCSDRNVQMVKELGADEVLPYTTPTPLHLSLARNLSSPFTVILDCVGVQALYNHSAAYLAQDGCYVSVGVQLPTLSYTSLLSSAASMLANTFWPSWLGGTPRPWAMVSMMEPEKGALERVGRMVERGEVRVLVEGCWEMGDIKEAYERMLSKRARGKVIVKLREEED